MNYESWCLVPYIYKWGYIYIDSYLPTVCGETWAYKTEQLILTYSLSLTSYFLGSNQ